MLGGARSWVRVRVSAVAAVGMFALACATGTADPPRMRPDAGLGPGSCPTGQELCGRVCAATDRDGMHCGSCDEACADGERCVEGACVVSCPTGQRVCDVGGEPSCVSTQSDPRHCGDCGVSCGGGEVCSLGTCTTDCEDGLIACTLDAGGTACADVARDAQHCGGCELACAPGQACVGGECAIVCPAGQDACGGLCVDLQTHDDNCGRCGQSCGVNETCAEAECVTACPAGTEDCGGICRDTASDSGHCGDCDAACGAGEVCDDGRCGLRCPMGQVACAGACVFTDRDPLHCGDCGVACPAPVGGSASCADSACAQACPVGQTNCGGICRDLSSNSEHCSLCDRPCAAGTRCVSAACIPDLPDLGGASFRIDELSASGCATVDHEAITGDDRGGIAVSTASVFYSGDDATGRFDRGDLGNAAVVPEILDAMVANVRTGALYALGADGAVLPRGGGTITQLIRLSTINLTPLTSGHVTLSTPIVATGGVFSSTVGLFSGYDRVVIHNGSAAFSVSLTDGAVTNLGAMSIPSRRICENWAYWGLAETDGPHTNLVLVRGSTAIDRVRVPSGEVLQTFSFSNLSDMCSIGAYAPSPRWYFHHENGSQFVAGAGEHVGFCDATFDTAGGRFVVTSMTANGCATYEHDAITGDDRGGLVVSPSYVFYSGDRATGRFNRNDLGLSPRAMAKRYDTMIGNVRTGQVYVLANGERILGHGGGTVTELILLNATSGAPTTTSIPLSVPITVAGSQVGIFSGYDRAVIHTGTRVLHIALPSGVVTDLGEMARPSAFLCESWAYWGVAEYFGGQLYLAYRRSSAPVIERLRVPDGVTSTIATFTNVSDLCSFTIAPALNRWYFHHEFSSQFATGAEILGYCSATWSSP